MKKLNNLLLLSLAIISGFTLHADNYLVTQLTENTAGDSQQELNNSVNGFVVVNIDNEIYRIDGTTSTLLSTTSTFNSNPELNDNGMVVWTGRGGTDAGTDFEVFIYDGTSTSQLTTNDDGESFPRINSSGQVVWSTFGGSDGGVDSEVMFFDGTNTTQITTNDVYVSSPKISDNGNLVWAEAGGIDGGSDNEIFLYNGITTIQLTSNTGTDTNAQINANGEVVWMGQGGSDAGTDFEVFFYDGNTVQITENTDSATNPQINDHGQLSWTGTGGTDGGSDREVFLFNGNSTLQLTKNTTSETQPQINNFGHVVWHASGGSDGGFDGEIFIFDGVKTFNITTNTTTEIEPKINELGYISWRGVGGSDSGSDYEIFIAMPDYDSDGQQDVIDTDDDGDGILDINDSHPLDANRTLVDEDGDGLVDITTLAELNAIRNNMEGTGLTLNTSIGIDSRGCFGDTSGASFCNGYELLNNLNFDTNADGIMNANDLYWNDGLGWEPIDDPEQSISFSFDSKFNGNYHTINNLYIDRPNTDHIGLFGRANFDGDIEKILISGPLTEITGLSRVGAVVGVSLSSINMSYSDATVTGSAFVGGIVGRLNTILSSIDQTYSTGTISGITNIGGITGRADGSISNSYSEATVNSTSGSSGGIAGFLKEEMMNVYAVGNVTGGIAGGLIGSHELSTISSSHWDVQSTNLLVDVGGSSNNAVSNAVGLSTVEMQCPTAPDNASCKIGSTIFNGWDQAIWDFNSSTEYPTLVWERDTDNDGILDVVDLDDDNDTFSDIEEMDCGSNSLDNTSIPVDTDLDDICDVIDLDDDNDTFSDIDETTCGSDPLLDTSLPTDSDSDGLCDNGIDVDDDDDGILDVDDAFPLDETESADTDNDGIGNNADLDDDGDQMIDTWETFYGLDALLDDSTLDLDNDGFSNLQEYLNGTDPNIPNAANQENTSLTRAAIAKQLLVRKYGSGFLPNSATGTVFTDVSIGDFNADWIERLAIDEITLGCTALSYCPDQVVTKEQLAILILKTNNGSDYTPPPATGTVFADVAIDDFAADWIEAFSNLGGTMGCDANNYCPDEVVSQEGLQTLLNNIIF